MVSAPVDPATATPPASAAPSATPSDERANPTPAVNPPSAPAAPVEASTPAQETPQAAVPPSTTHEPTAAPRDFAELQRRHDAIARGESGIDPLTSDERSDLARHQQSQADTARARAQANQAYQQNQVRIRSLTQALPDKLADVYVKRLGVDPTSEQAAPLLELARREIVEHLGETFSELEPIVLSSWEAAIHSSILQWGNNSTEAQRTVEGLRGKGFDMQIQAVSQAAFDLGQKTNPDAKKLSETQSKLETANAEIERLKGVQLGQAGTVSTTGNPAQPATFSSEADLNRAYNKGDVDRSTYATEYKRLTGREP